MGVWDINCWYQAQMPGHVDDLDTGEGGAGLCPYLSVCEVGGVDVVALQVEHNTLTRFGSGGQGVEQHFYPSSLKFSLNIVTPEGYFQAVHLGLQRKVLAELGRSQSLVKPSELYQYCLLSGKLIYKLLSKFKSFSPGLANGPQLEPSLLQQRRALLSVALEQSLGKSLSMSMF